MSFFHLSELVSKPPPPALPLCAKCGLLKQCKTPKMEPTGRGRKGILIVGDFPGEHEDSHGYQFVGPSGDLLRRLLLKWGVTLREDCVLTNALACSPKHGIVKKEEAVEFCRPLVLKAISEYDPTVIIPLGKRAVRSVIGHLWREDTGGVFRWIGWKIPCRKPNVWVCPSINPAYVLRQRKPYKARQAGESEYKDEGLSERYLEEHLKKAVELAGTRPWKEVPDYTQGCELLHDDSQAAKAVLDFVKAGEATAWDYETNMLKPQSESAKIVCCSLSNGKRTVAFFWRGEAKKAMLKFLKSDVPKIASNMAFEHNWSNAVAGVEVNNWYWDTMLMSHALDNRREITSIKFQAFCRLGQEDYDWKIKPFLTSKKGADEENTIRDIEPDQLLLYCALDSVLEWKVARQQTKELGVRWPQ